MKKRLWTSAILFTLLLGGVLYLLNASINDDSASVVRVQMHELYSSSDEYDLLFLGASPVARGFDTDCVDRELSCNSFNLGGSSQKLVESYYLLEEALRHHSVGAVVLHCGYSTMTFDLQSHNTNYSILNHMRPSLNKARFSLWSTGRVIYEEFATGHARKKNVFDLAERLDTLNRTVFSPTYRAYSLEGALAEEFEYRGKGFLACYSSIEDGLVRLDDNDTDTRWADGNGEWLRKIILLCRERDIPLVLCSVPFHPVKPASLQGGYDAAMADIAALAGEYGVPLWDFCLARDSFLHLTNSDFADASHLSAAGAEKFSAFFAQVYDTYLSGGDVSEYFSASWAEREKEIDAVCAVELGTEISDKGVLTASASPIMPRGMRAEYRFELFQGDEPLFSGDYGDAAEFTYLLKDGAGYSLKVYARAAGSAAEYDAAATETGIGLPA